MSLIGCSLHADAIELIAHATKPETEMNMLITEGQQNFFFFYIILPQVRGLWSEPAPKQLSLGFLWVFCAVACCNSPAQQACSIWYHIEPVESCFFWIFKMRHQRDADIRTVHDK